ncbi:SRPBCC family protein [Streptomyces sp. AD2-2]|nr:SRPBCC family protein [Streptomyces sp. AD2-2]
MTRNPAPLGERVTVLVPPDIAYAAVADVTRMGQWSPEVRGARVLGGPGPVRVGTRFVGLNRASWLPWATLCTVVSARPGSCFAFKVSFLGVALSQWTYRFREVPGGCEITEEWLDLRSPVAGRLLTAVSPAVTGVLRRRERNRATMRATLAALRGLWRGWLTRGGVGASGPGFRGWLRREWGRPGRGSGRWLRRGCGGVRARVQGRG